MRLLLTILLTVGLCVWLQTLAEQGQGVVSNIHVLSSDDKRKAPLQVSPSEQLTAILERLTSLDRTVGQLKEQVALLLLQRSSNHRIHKVLQDLQGVCEELKGSQIVQPTPGYTTTATPNTTSNAPVQSFMCPQQPRDNQFRVTTVRKVETQTFYIVTVCYVAPEKSKILVRRSAKGQYRRVRHADFGTLTLRHIKPDDGEPADIGIQFQLPRQAIYISLKLGENSTDEVHLPNVQVQQEPEADVTTTPGNDINIQLHEIVVDGHSLIQNHLHATGLWVKSNTENNTVDAYRLEPNRPLPEDLSDAQYNETRSADGNKTLSLRLPYTSARNAGIMVYHTLALLNCTDDCLVYRYTVVHHAVFYPVGQSSPFSDHFVGFLMTKWARRNAKGGKQVGCYLGPRQQYCRLSCEVVGDDPTVTITKADHRSPPSGYDLTVTTRPFHAQARWAFRNVTVQDAGEYACVARSGGGGPVVKQTMTLTVT